jgi:hypothetical protein
MDSSRALTREAFTPTPQGKKGKLTLIISAIILILVGGTAYAYSAHDVFKSPKQIYLEAEVNNYQLLVDGFTKSYDENYQLNVKPYLENSVHSKSEISANVEGLGLEDPQLKMVLDILKSSKLLVDGYTDQKNQQNYSKVDLSFKGNNIIGVEAFADKEKLGFGVPAIYKKYAIADLKDRNKLKEKYGIDLPKKIISYSDVAEAIKLSKDELDPIFKTYSDIYVQSLNDKNVNLTSGTFNEEGTKIDARQITVTYSEKEYKDLLKKITEEAAKDQKLMDLAYNKYDKIRKLMEESGNNLSAAGVEKLSKADFEKSYKEASKEWVKSVDEIALSEGVKMVLLIDQKDNILSREISVKDKKNTLKVKNNNWTDAEGQSHGNFNMTTKEANNGEFQVKFTYVDKAEGSNHNGKFNLAFNVNNEFVKDNTKLESDYKITKDGNHESGDFKFKVNIDYSGEKASLTGSMKTDLTDNDKDKSRDKKFDLKVTVGDSPSPEIKGATFSLKVNTKEEFGAEVKLPKLDASNTLDLANMSPEELQQVEMEIQTAAQEFLFKNISLFQGME